MLILVVFYLYLLPIMIQSKINNGGGGGKIIVSKVRIGEMGADNMPFEASMKIATPLSSLPLRVGLEGLEVKLMAGDSHLATIDMQRDFDLYLNSEFKLDLQGKIVVTRQQGEEAQKLLSSISSENGVQGLKLSLNFAPCLKINGMTLYRSLPLYRNIDVGDSSTSLKNIINVMKSKPQKPSSIVYQPQDAVINLESMFPSEDITVLPESYGSKKLVWRDLKFPMDDNSFGVEFAAAFMNPTVFDISQIDSVEFAMELEGAKCAKVEIKKIMIKQGLNENFNIGFQTTLIDSEIDPVAVRAAIEKASTNYADSGDFNFAITGPIRVTGADFVETATKGLRISGKYSDLQRLRETTDSTTVENKQETSESDSKSYLGNSDISLSVVGERVLASLGLNLPLLSFIKPPAGLEFPYHSTVSFYGESNKLFEFGTTPIQASRSQGGMLIKVGAELLADNSPTAVDQVAKTINPVLAMEPKVNNLVI